MLLKTITDYLREMLHKFDCCPSDELMVQVGPQYNYSEKIVKKVLITQYLTLDSIKYAKKAKYNLILCKYGLPIDSLPRIDELTQKFLLLLIQSHIMVGVLPPSWNYMVSGPIEYLAHVLGLHFDKFLLDAVSNSTGKIYSSKKDVTMESILSVFHRSLNIEFINVYSRQNSSHKLFSIIPINLTSNIIKNAKFQGCDCIICPEISSISLSALKFFDISCIQIPFHHAMESTLRRFCSILAMEFPRNEFEFFPSEIILQTHCRKQNH